MKVARGRDLVRNDCTMVLVCEHCGHIQDDRSAYNDHYYIYTVVPKERYCDECGKNAVGEKHKQPSVDDLQDIKFGQEQ